MAPTQSFISEGTSPSLCLKRHTLQGSRGIWSQSVHLLALISTLQGQQGDLESEYPSPRSKVLPPRPSRLAAVMPVHLPPLVLDSGRAQQFGPRLLFGYFTANPSAGRPAIRHLPTRSIVDASHLPSRH